ncbi:MAG TPA: DUF4296 domain-containing protein [Saprospiraceae bacterium]|nr:MAG: hypothetical protein UZ08_BCD001000662 [Candidatus Parvibacillus calidus]MBX2936181.1 DUF4296 domain-containing protein [Saprospiraceae bacterium]MBX7178381.1 DUF4296 domain-containing protein [Saprospiraceae bacterium]MCB0589868.1 DUF4296 domain-containing protein [Saprospiraceae bacterium]MCC7149788.1 DUF4296 domain-containing protein [Saprospiraceae bacterium]
MRRLMFFIFLTLSSCTKQKAHLTEEDVKFADVMVDIYMANGAANQIKAGNKDSLRNALVYDILMHQGIDTNAFYQKLRTMEKNPERFKLLTDTIVKKLERLSNN